MTAWNSTSTNTLNLLGCPSDLWGSYNWGAFKWGSGTADLPVRVIHLVTNTLSPTEDSIGHAVRHLVTNTLAPTEDSIGHAVRHLVTNTLAPTEDSIGHAILHLVTNTLVPTEDEAGFKVVKLVSNGITLTDTEANNFYKAIANALNITEDMAYEYLQDAANWNYVFHEGVTNAHLQSTQTWTQPSSSSVTWSTVAAGSTTWS